MKTHKSCSDCHAIKPASAFAARNQSSDGMQYRCRACDKQVQRNRQNRKGPPPKYYFRFDYRVEYKGKLKTGIVGRARCPYCLRRRSVVYDGVEQSWRLSCEGCDKETAIPPGGLGNWPQTSPLCRSDTEYSYIEEWGGFTVEPAPEFTSEGDDLKADLEAWRQAENVIPVVIDFHFCLINHRARKIWFTGVLWPAFKESETSITSLSNNMITID